MADDSALYRKPLPPSTQYLKPNDGKRNGNTRALDIKTNNQLYNDTRGIEESIIVAGLPHIHPLYPKGPPPLPMGKIIRHSNITQSLPPPQSFTLTDFLVSPQEADQRPVISTNSIILSRDNYLKMTSWFATNIPTQSIIHTKNIEIEQLAVEARKPQHQLLIEFKSILNELLSDYTKESRGPNDTQLLDNTDDVLIQNTASRYFCGEQRTSSPFDDSCGNDVIGLAEVAILQSMMKGGHSLSFKAHFLSELPSLLPLATTLTHLNVSFNCLQVFPMELCKLTQLKDLRLRNNPIRVIPSAIRSLKNLQLLSIPFNLLTDLPPGLFELYSLEDLDVSHNSLQWISRDIHKLCNLKRLNVECNQLTGLPVTALNIQLQHLSIDSNYFHHLLWKENTHNTPQMLSDICCIVLAKEQHREKEKYPNDIKSQLNKPTGKCDYCQGPMYGCGLRAIRSVSSNNVIVRNLPFIFHICSPSCYYATMNMEHLKWKKDHIDQQ